MAAGVDRDAAAELADARRALGRDVVAVVLAVGLMTALNVIAVAAVVDAFASDPPTLSENATQVLTGAFGGVVGVLAAYLGYKAGASTRSVDQGPAQAAAQVRGTFGEAGDALHVGGRPPSAGA